MKFKHTVGIELTGVPKIPFDVPNPSTGYTDYDRHDKFKEKIQKDLGGLSWEEGTLYRSHVDGHCFEVPSPIFSDRSSTKKWFLAVRRVMKKHGLKPHHDDVVCGGGHIHVGLRSISLKRKVVKAIRRDYFLPWVFSQPDEEYSCDNGGFGKDASVYQSYCTLEFRFFESALNWSEQWDHLEFVLKYINWVQRTKDPGPMFKDYPYSSGCLNSLGKEEVINEFKDLLKELKLPYSRYRKYVKRNLLPRWELDRVRR